MGTASPLPHIHGSAGRQQAATNRGAFVLLSLSSAIDRHLEEEVAYFDPTMGS